MKNVIKWNIVGFLFFLLFTATLKIENTFIIYVSTFMVYFLAGIIVKKQKIKSKYFILLPLNLILFFTVFFNELLFPLIVPVVNVFSILGFFLGNSFNHNKSKQIIIFGSLNVLLFIFTFYQFIPQQAFRKSIKSKNNGLEIKEINLFDLKGNAIKSTEFVAKVVVLNFTFIGCGLCVQKSPYLDKLKDSFEPNSNIVFYDVFVNSKNAQNEIEKYHLKFPSKLKIALDKNNSLASSLSYNGAPHEVIIDKKGIVRRTLTGFNSDLNKIYMNSSKELLTNLVNSN